MAGKKKTTRSAKKPAKKAAKKAAPKKAAKAKPKKAAPKKAAPKKKAAKAAPKKKPAAKKPAVKKPAKAPKEAPEATSDMIDVVDSEQLEPTESEPTEAVTTEDDDGDSDGGGDGGGEDGDGGDEHSDGGDDSRDGEHANGGGALKGEILAMAKQIYGDRGEAELLDFDPNTVDAMDPAMFYELIGEKYGIQPDESDDNFGGFGGSIRNTIAFVEARWDGSTRKDTPMPPGDWLEEYVHPES